MATIPKGQKGDLEELKYLRTLKTYRKLTKLTRYDPYSFTEYHRCRLAETLPHSLTPSLPFLDIPHSLSFYDMSYCESLRCRTQIQ